MNLPQFLKKIDTFSSRMSRVQLERLLHEIARTAPEKERERLLFFFFSKSLLLSGGFCIILYA